MSKYYLIACNDDIVWGFLTNIFFFKYKSGNITLGATIKISNIYIYIFFFYI